MKKKKKKKGALYAAGSFCGKIFENGNKFYMYGGAVNFCK